jgi:DNA-binding transcriptional MocR family regulator
MWYSELEEFKMPANPENTVATYEKLRSSILALELEPGENLTERALETLLETSRTTVRAALQRLEGEGLVQKAGFSVTGNEVMPIEPDLPKFRRCTIGKRKITFHSESIATMLCGKIISGYAVFV